MRINLWYCDSMEQWRWTLTKNDRPVIKQESGQRRWTLVDNSRPIVKQESGQRPDLRDAMSDIANTVEYILNSEHK